MQDQYSNLPALQRDIVRFILSQPPQDEGVHVAVIAKAIGASGEDARKIRFVLFCCSVYISINHRSSDALDKLMDDGHVFTTIDDSHFNVSL